ncbi:MAG: TolC family protein [Verrucomicrobia bacterium]|nr:TolC family protein [Verrucomicrobiota bacterium]
MKTKILCSLLLLGTVGGIAATNDTASAPPLRITPALVNQFAEEMATNHPALLAARARTNAAAAGIKTVRTWEDPMARVGVMAAERAMREDNGDVFYSLEQKLPLLGKPGAMRKMAAAELAVEVAAEDVQFQTLRSDLAKALFRAALADEALNIAEQDLAWLDITTKIVEGGYRSGSVRLMDVLTLQNEQSKRVEQLKTDRDKRAQAILAVNRFLTRDLAAPWPTLQLPPVADAIVYSDRLASFALRYEPRLRKMREEIRATEDAVNVARKERWPDVSIGFENRNYSRSGELRQSEFMVGFSIPLGNAPKYRAAVRREEEKRKAAEFDAKDYEQSIREEVHGLIVKISAMRREALLYRDQIIPRSEQALASARSMFESGGMLRDMLDTRRMLLEGKLMYVRAVAEQYEMLSELVLCCGLGDLEAIQMLSADSDSKTEPTKP